jgi:hypothetical protein
MDQQTASLATRPQSAAPAAKTQQAMADEASQPQAFSPQYALEPQARPASATTAANAQRPLAAGAGAADAASRMRSRPSPDFLADRHQPPPGCFGAQVLLRSKRVSAFGCLGSKWTTDRVVMYHDT